MTRFPVQKLLALLGLAFVLAGCAYPKKSTPFRDSMAPKEKAVVYLYRMQTPIHSANFDVPRFFINGEFVGRMSIGGYYRVEVEPGDIKISYRDSLFGIPFPWDAQKKVLFNIAPGEKKYVQFGVSAFWGDELRLMAPNVGAAQIQKTHLLVYD